MKIFTGIDKIEDATHGHVWRIVRTTDTDEIKAELSIAVYHLQINSEDSHTLYLFPGKYTEADYSSIKHILFYPDIVKDDGCHVYKFEMCNVTIPTRYGVVFRK